MSIPGVVFIVFACALIGFGMMEKPNASPSYQLAQIIMILIAAVLIVMAFCSI